MQAIITNLAAMATAAGGKIILALLVLIIGNILIKSVLKFLGKSKMMDKIEGTVRTFILSFLKAGLYAILAISIIGIMGVPMASVVAVLASAGVAIGLALQGALSNLAGGIMLMIFKPFHQGDYVSAAGVEGVVKEVTLFYTVILTLDNKRITVPNGSLMNANITDYSAEELRRVDLQFACAKSEAPAKIQDMMIAANAPPMVTLATAFTLLLEESNMRSILAEILVFADIVISSFFTFRKRMRSLYHAGLLHP